MGGCTRMGPNGRRPALVMAKGDQAGKLANLRQISNSIPGQGGGKHGFRFRCCCHNFGGLKLV